VTRSWPLFVALATAGTGAALSADPAPPTGTTTIVLPRDVGPTFKPGPGADVAEQHCTSCHSAAYVAIQPPLTSAQWTAEVTKMRHAFGAPIPDDAAAAIVQYLVAEYGKQ
jgi:sulfite dehydrogenase (cytochrome) subunit B